jgi:PEP-CTERM motif
LRKSWFIILGLTALLLPTRANASELAFQQMGLHDIVTIGGDVSGTFYAGEIDWKWVPGGQDIYTYCVDILNEVTDPQTVRISDTTDPEMQLSTTATDAGAKAAWLLNKYASDIHAGGSGLEAAALQVAIWEAISDDAYNLTAGSFQLAAGGVFDKAQEYLGALATADYHSSVAIWLDATRATGGCQDQIATPEPSSLMLLGVAGLFVRRRKQKSSPSRRIDAAWICQRGN